MARLDAESAHKAVQDLEADPETLRIVASMMLGINSPVESRDAASARLELERLRAKLRDLTVELTEDHPQVIALAKTIDDLATGNSGTTRRLAKAYVEALSQRFARAKAKEDQLRGQFNALEKRLVDLNSKAADYRLLVQNESRTRDTITMLEKRIDEININEVDTESTTRIPSPGCGRRKHDHRRRRRRPRQWPSSRCSDYSSGSAWRGSADCWTNGFALWTMSQKAPARHRSGLCRARSSPTAASSTRGRTIASLPRRRAHCVRLSTLGCTSKARPRFHVTSPDPGDGKSITSSGLAIAMAQAGQRTLLLDGDMRKPRQHKMFGLKNDVGLSTVLAGIDQSKAAIQRTPLEDLHVLTAGPIPPNPAELLNSPAFKKLLDELGRYDRIVIDSPPVLPVADARIIASKADMSVMVLRVDKSTRKRAAAAVASLESVNASILGAVLNDMPKGIGYGYGSGYGYYDYKYYGDEKTGESESGKSRRKVAS